MIALLTIIISVNRGCLRNPTPVTSPVRRFAHRSPRTKTLSRLMAAISRRRGHRSAPTPAISARCARFRPLSTQPPPRGTRLDAPASPLSAPGTPLRHPKRQSRARTTPLGALSTTPPAPIRRSPWGITPSTRGITFSTRGMTKFSRGLTFLAKGGDDSFEGAHVFLEGDHVLEQGGHDFFDILAVFRLSVPIEAGMGQ